MITVTKNNVKINIVDACLQPDEWWQNIYPTSWEPETFVLFDKYLSSDMTYLDLGTYTGHTILYAAQKVKRAFGVDLAPLASRACAANIKASHLSNTVLEHCAISHKNGEVFINESLQGTSGCHITDSSRISVPAFTIESLADRWGVNKFDFIKMDIEGAEEAVLPAMRQFLKKQTPSLYLSVHLSHGVKPETIAGLLDVYKYAYFNGKEVASDLLNTVKNGPQGYGNEYFFTNK